MIRWRLLLAALPLLTACSNDPESTAAGASSGGQPGGGGGGSGTGGQAAGGGTSTGGASGAGASGSGPIGPGGAHSGVTAGPFRYGINGGFPNPNWNDQNLAFLEVNVGCNSQRLSLPERHLDTWGLDIEVGDLQGYVEQGLTRQVAFLTSPIRAHSTAPAGVEDWELAHYLPANLYEPITLASGEINPDNYWAQYVHDVVATYSPWIGVWEIWNEPDWVDDWSVTLEWSDRAPTAADLPRFNGSVFDYVRMLRVSSVAAKLADPDAQIATGGIGYASFLGAVLRYTDNPTDGSVTAEYPERGGVYLDVLSFHHYPIYSAGASDDAVDGYLDHRTELAGELEAAGVTVSGWQTTESGAPHVAVGDYPGGAAYARNYLMKLMVLAQAAGNDGVDWFMLGDAAAPGASDDPYAFMGLYEDVSDLVEPGAAVRTDTGVAYATLGALLGGAIRDVAGTVALGLPDEVRGAVFETRDGGEALALWVRVAAADEAASGEWEVSGDQSYLMHEWDWSTTQVTERLVSSGGSVVLPLTGSVRIFVRQ